MGNGGLRFRCGPSLLGLERPGKVKRISFAVRLSCVATGTPSLSFIWQKDTMFLGGQTNATLVITNAQATDGGRYRVTVSNNDGIARSDPADVIVYAEHICDFPPSWVAHYRSRDLAEAIAGGGQNLGAATALVPDSMGNLFVTGNGMGAGGGGKGLCKN